MVEVSLAPLTPITSGGKHSTASRPQSPLSLAGRVVKMKDAKHDPLRAGGAGGAACRRGRRPGHNGRHRQQIDGQRPVTRPHWLADPSTPGPLVPSVSSVPSPPPPPPPT
ncbi:hypothetical protein E2C01_028852 [Portunus trituberculatus]|uniref:Uncharacterized protein n=1 Tax=Portunus trituberculatus TaxID=210409 RepID=A0A5B7ELJ6_PORTR|nr:hypothetical protein [Portunus trituberculatus]